MRWITRRNMIVMAVVLVAGVAFLVRSRRSAAPRYLTTVLERGDIAETVGATGTLQAVTTVQVGSQVSGTIQSLGADFNSVVRRGQVIARLDPSLLEARLGQARASHVVARANVDRQKATVTDMRQKYDRAQALFAEQLVPESDLETARANYDGALAQLKANDAAVSQAEANVNQAEVDLNHTVITTPIDGVVIARNVDVGQTVAASFQAPVLFVIANDLTRMQVNAAVDEADVGRVQPGQDVTFRVDAYPDRSFPGRVDQVRLQPQTIQNVVSYNAIITVDNSEQKLMPGMTATVSVVVRKAENVLRLPAAALRFRPAGFQAEGGRGPRDGRPVDSTASDAGGADRGAGAGAVQAAEREARGSLVFVLGEGRRPEPARVQVGLSDGQFVEVRDGLTEGAQVVTGLDAGDGRAAGGVRTGPSPSSSANPFAPGPPPRRQR